MQKKLLYDVWYPFPEAFPSLFPEDDNIVILVGNGNAVVVANYHRKRLTGKAFSFEWHHNDAQDGEPRYRAHFIVDEGVRRYNKGDFPDWYVKIVSPPIIGTHAPKS
jgi:hypothetical protein